MRMSTQTQLINPFYEHNLNRLVSIEKNILIPNNIHPSSDLTVINSGNNNTHYLIRIVSLSQKHFVGLPRNDLIRQVLHREKKASRYRLGDLSL